MQCTTLPSTYVHTFCGIIIKCTNVKMMQRHDSYNMKYRLFVFGLDETNSFEFYIESILNWIFEHSFCDLASVL